MDAKDKPWQGEESNYAAALVVAPVVTSVAVTVEVLEASAVLVVSAVDAVLDASLAAAFTWRWW